MATSLLSLNDPTTSSVSNHPFASMPISLIEGHICEIARRMQISEPEKHLGLLVQNSPAVTPYATVFNEEREVYAISVPYTFLLNTSDIEVLFQSVPPRLHFPFRANPRDYSYIQLLEIHHALQEKLGLPLTPLSLEEQEGFRVFLQYIQDPEKSEQAKIFTLGHEVAHIAHKHICKASPPTPAIAKPLDKLGLVGTIIKKKLARSVDSFK